jgi:hypothetical protein
LKETINYLIEGVECKEILIERNKQLRSKDSVIALQTKAIDSTKQITTQIKKDYITLVKDNDECNKQYNKLRTSYDKKQNQLMLFKGTTIGLIIVTLIQIAI